MTQVPMLPQGSAEELAVLRAELAAMLQEAAHLLATMDQLIGRAGELVEQSATPPKKPPPG
jgi:hypothetical protein